MAKDKAKSSPGYEKGALESEATPETLEVSRFIRIMILYRGQKTNFGFNPHHGPYSIDRKQVEAVQISVRPYSINVATYKRLKKALDQ